MEEEISNDSMVTQLQKIRDQIGLEIQDLNPEQVIEYYNNDEGFLPKEVWSKAKAQQTEQPQ